MIKRIIVVLFFLLGVVVIVSWLLQLQHPASQQLRNRSTIISALLLLASWTIPFILYVQCEGKKSKRWFSSR